MGNSQCGPRDTVVDFEEMDAEYTTTAADMYSSSNKNKNESIDQKVERFLAVEHSCDRQSKWILDLKQVELSQRAQAEALVRRDLLRTIADDPVMLENYHPHNDNDDDDSGIAATETPVLRTPSQISLNNWAPHSRTSSAVTSWSAATSQARNSDPMAASAKAKFQQRRRNPNPKPLGKDFAFREHIDRDVDTIIAIAQNEVATPSPLASVLHQTGLSRPLTACGAATNVRTGGGGSTVYGKRVREYMGTLHLRFQPHSADFYHRYLARLLPENPVTQAVGNAIAATQLATTTRPQQQQQRHGRNNNNNNNNNHNNNHSAMVEWDDDLSTDSSNTSTSDSLDFGIGPPAQSIRMLVTGTSFLDLAITGSLGLVNRGRKPRSTVADRKYVKTPEHYLVLLNRRSGFPLAVCALKAASTGAPVVRVYATKRRVLGQSPVATTQELGLSWSSNSFPLYTWAEIVTEGSYPARVRYSIFMASGSEGRFEETASYLAVHETSGSPDIRVVGKTEHETDYLGCAMLSLCHSEDDDDDDDVVSTDDTFLRVSVAGGIDPSLMLCFAAFVDESMEKTMRLQTQRLKENTYRNHVPH